MGPYAYRKKRWILGAGLLDAFGYRLRRPPASAVLRPRRCLVIRLDHMGDVILSLPVFNALRHSFPGIHIACLTTPLGADVLRLAGAADDYFAWNCPWFDPRRRETIHAGRVAEWIVSNNFDCVFELRGDVRLIWMMRRLGVGTLVGYGATGGGFLLDVNVPWNPGLHAAEKNLALVEAIGGVAAERRPLFPPELRTSRAAAARPAVRIALHPDAGNAAKRWPAERFAEIMKRLHGAFPVEFDLIGLDAALGERVQRMSGVPARSHMGKMSLSESAEVLRQCEFLISNDSGPAHLMAALDRPVWVLWSGTAPASVWAPVGADVHVIESGARCEPCRRGRFGEPHPCMNAITVQQVYESIAAHLKGRLA